MSIALTIEGKYAFVPVWDYAASSMRWAVVDADDFELVSWRRWFVHGGYAASKPSGRWVWMHREVLAERGSAIVDHRNGRTLDNRRENLRLTDASGNGQNRPKGANANSTTGVRGVFKRPSGRYEVRVKAKGKTHWGGTHSTLEEAAAAAEKLRQFIAESERQGG
jgi:hypothetical protein